METFLKKYEKFKFEARNFFYNLTDSKKRQTAVCVLNGDAKGTLFLEQTGEHGVVKISGEISNLTKGLHGFHVHEFGDQTNGCMSAGAHYNPHCKMHGGPDDEERHLGDLGNIRSDGEKASVVHICDRQLSLFGKYSIIGRTLVLHAEPDDLGKGGHELSKITGNSGSRIACGIIGVSKP